jgi:hypothetical protein
MFCVPGDQVTVTVTWAASTATDADGNLLVRYYGVLRGVNGATPAPVGGVPGAPPPATYTDQATCTGGFLSTMTLSYEVQAATATSGGFRSAYSTPVATVSVIVF